MFCALITITPSVLLSPNPLPSSLLHFRVLVGFVLLFACVYMMYFYNIHHPTASQPLSASTLLIFVPKLSLACSRKNLVYTTACHVFSTLFLSPRHKVFEIHVGWEHLWLSLVHKGTPGYLASASLCTDILAASSRGYCE
jgi:hypothetical protein